jgi:hypothetical protein
MAVLETCITSKQLVNKLKQHIYMYVCMGIEVFFEDSYLPLYIPHTVNSILYYQTEKLLQPGMSESSITSHILHTCKMFASSQFCLPVVLLLGDCSSFTPLFLTLRP